MLVSLSIVSLHVCSDWEAVGYVSVSMSVCGDMQRDSASVSLGGAGPAVRASLLLERLLNGFLRYGEMGSAAHAGYKM